MLAMRFCVYRRDKRNSDNEQSRENRSLKRISKHVIVIPIISRWSYYRRGQGPVIGPVKDGKGIKRIIAGRGNTFFVSYKGRCPFRPIIFLL